jgi:hypothetical protein
MLVSSVKALRVTMVSIVVLASATVPASGAALASPVPQACGNGQPAVVVGQNNPVLDVSAVQAAANGGGSVLLEGTFDFGDSGRVVLSGDVEICGETDDAGSPVTTIRRGEWSFFTPYPASMPPPFAGPKVAITHIHFVQSRGSAIHLGYSGGASIAGNVIDQMRARQTGATKERAAIVVGPAILGGVPNTQFVPRLVSGNINVLDNKIDVSTPTDGTESTTTTRATGMFVSMYVGADVRIEHNFVTGNTRTGLAILDGTFDANGRGSVVIADNTIHSDVRSGFVAAGPRAPLGIVTGFNNQRAFGSDPHLVMIPVLIDRNTIELGNSAEAGVASPPMGIVTIWNGAVITHNSITVHGHSASTIDRLSTSGGILATASNQALMHNAIAGQGCNAIRIGGTLDNQERFGNVGVANNVTQFQAFSAGYNKCADVWLEPASHDNTMVGNSGSVIDDGTNNKITGFGPVSGGVGDVVSEAEHDANEASLDLA